MTEEMRRLIDEQNRLLNESRAAAEGAMKEHNGIIPADVRQKIDEIDKRLDQVTETLDVLVKQEKRASSLPAQYGDSGIGSMRPAAAQGNGQEEARKIQMDQFRSYLATGQAGQELRALSAGVQTEGGFLVAPMQFVSELIKDIDRVTHIRQLARVFTVSNATSLGAPVLDTDPADADWTTELASGSLDTAMNFGQRVLTPSPAAKRVKISKKLLAASVIPVDTLVRERLAYKFGITQEKGFITGNGASKPLGLMVASNQGIDTSRDVSTGNSSTAIAVDGLINALESLEDGYQANATWLFHRDAVKQIRQLKDSYGQYLLQPRISETLPETILGKPYRRSEYMPNTFTTGLYVGIIGDFSHYWIADSLTMQIQRLVELYAESNQDGYIARMECDGMPVLAKAFARVKLA